MAGPKIERGLPVTDLPKVAAGEEKSVNWLGKTVAWLRSSKAKKVLAVALSVLLTVSIVGIIPLALGAKEWKAQNELEASNKAKAQANALTVDFLDTKLDQEDIDLIKDLERAQ